MFRRRIARLRQSGDLAALWDIADDLGGQVSVVRHDLREMRQAAIIRDFRLFGDEELGIPGAFGELRDEVRVLRDSLQVKATARMQRWSRWWVAAGVVVAMLALLTSCVFSVLTLTTR